MALQAVTENSIRKLRWEVDELNQERDYVKLANPARATYLQSLIFQKFAIVEVLWKSVSEMWPTLQVLSLKYAVNGSGKDLQEMSIPKLVAVKTLQEWTNNVTQQRIEPFPYFSLPPEVRTMILNNLTFPSDKLNFLKAFPEEGKQLTKWNRNSLRWELVLPIVFAQNDELNAEDAVKLCQASTELHNVVTNCYERNLAQKFLSNSKENYIGKGVFWSPTAALVLNPFPATVKWELFVSPEDDEHQLNQLQGLRQIGKNLWSVYLNITASPDATIRRAIEVIRDGLELMPNLRHLAVNAYLDVGTAREPESVHAFGDVQLPDLVQLKKLGMYDFNISVVSAKLLEKYGPVVTCLEANHIITLPILSVGYSRLTHLNLKYYEADNDDIPDTVARLEPFVGAPVKSLRFQGGYIQNGVQDFQSVLCALTKFGDTLEDLLVQFAYIEEPDDGEGESPDLSWLATLNFPKVKTLEVKGFPRTWAVLAQFPALEKLTVNRYRLDQPFPQNFGRLEELSSVVLEMSYLQEELYTANIWKLLPFLNVIEVVRSSDGRTPRDAFQVTRSQCRAYAQKLATIMLDLEPATTIHGAVEGIRQPVDTALIVEGTVDGDLVQEGNGCILVKGNVDGNITQKGNGQILIGGTHTGQLVKTGEGSVHFVWENL